MTLWTSETAQAEFTKWNDHYAGKTPQGGMMILSLCVMLVGIGIAILAKLEKLENAEKRKMTGWA